MKKTKASKDLDAFVAKREQDLLAQVDFLRQANSRLSSQLNKKTIAKTELVEAVYRAVADVLPGIQLDNTIQPTKTKSKKTSEYAMVLACDWQIGKLTPTYNTQVCERRVIELADKIRKLTDIQRADHPVNNLRVYALGDFVEGELIFPNQAHLIDSSLFRQVCVDGPRIFGNFLRTMLSHFDNVHVVGVSGNHGGVSGRQRKESHPETNADRMLYNITEKVLANENRLTWCVPDASCHEELGFWYSIDTVGSKRYLAFHGDQLRGGGFAGIPVYGFFRALAQWGSGVIPGGFDSAFCGHFHTCSSLLLNNKRLLFVGGSIESTNVWAAEQLKQRADPSQYLLFAHPENGITSEHRIWLK